MRTCTKRAVGGLILAATLALAPAVLAEEPYLVKDIKVKPDSSSSPYDLRESNGKLFFRASTHDEGAELWMADPATGATSLVKDIYPGLDSSSPTPFGTLGGWYYFTAQNETYGRELWRTDGTTTEMFADIYPGGGGSSPYFIAELGGKMYFRAADPDHGHELWATDGTTTWLVADLDPNITQYGSPASSYPYLQGVAGDVLYLRAQHSIFGHYQYWRVTASGVQRMRMKNPNEDFTSQYISNAFGIADGTMYFTSYYGAVDGVRIGTELWKMSQDGIELVADLWPGSTTYTVTRSDGTTYDNTTLNSSSPSFIAELNGTLLFRAQGVDANGDPTGYELYTVDAGGTVSLVTDLNPGTYTNSNSTRVNGNSSSPSLFEVRGGKLYFRAYTPTTGYEIFETDGTAANTKLYLDVVPGTYVHTNGNTYVNSSSPVPFGVANGKTIFRASDSVNGAELWALDWATGTAQMLGDLNPGTGYYYPYRLGNAGGKLIFYSYNHPDYRYEPFVTDGTPTGTMLLKDIVPGSRYSYLNYSYAAEAGGLLFFPANDLQIGTELWATDGTTAGTGVFADIEEKGFSHSYPQFLAELSGRLVFYAEDGIHEGAHGRELWTSDGTEAGTELVKDINPDWPTSSPYKFALIGDEMIFRANDGTHGNELWKTDGTAGNATLLADIYPGSGSTYPGFIAQLGSTVYFSANDGTNGTELWKTDGNTVQMVDDVYPGSTTITYTRSDGTTYDSTYVNSGSPSLFAEVNGTIYLRAQSADANGLPTGYEIFKLTPAGVVLVADLWPETYTRSNNDGTFAQSSYPTYVATLNGKVLFRARDADGYKLWSLDPTDDSITLLESDANYYYSGYVVGTVGGKLLFQAQGINPANGEETGYELFATDGTPGGMELLVDLAPGTYTYTYTYSDGTVYSYTYAFSSNPRRFAERNGLLYFTASSHAHGNELFSTDGTAANTKLVFDIYPGAREYDYYGTVVTIGYGSNPVFLTEWNGDIYFRALDAYHGYEIWKVDAATMANPEILKDIAPGAGSGYGYPVPALGYLYFTANDNEHGQELWRTDGTEDGTKLVKDLVPGRYSGNISIWGEYGNRLYFRGYRPEEGYELWALEPTPVLNVDFYENGTEIDWVALKPMEFGIAAEDWDGDALTITGYLDNQPLSDSTTAAMSTPQGTNPVTSTFTWTPLVADAGSHELRFVVSDGTKSAEYRLLIELRGDSDGDGLPDYWETDGYWKAGVFVDLPHLKGVGQTEGAKWDRPDIFVEIDYMKDAIHDQKPFNQALEWVAKSFADRGIALHVFIDDPVPFVEDLGTDPDNYDWSDFDDIKAAYFTYAYGSAFRYCLFAHDLGPSKTSGISRNVPGSGDLGASDFIVSLGEWPNETGTQDEQAGTFMHELGHTLGLLHGGCDHEKNKPNYISVMNYLFQFGLSISQLAAGEEHRKFDYSFLELEPLDEVNLNEFAGLREAIDNGDGTWTYVPIPTLSGYGTKWYYHGSLTEYPEINGPIDWNNDGDTADPKVVTNANEEGGYTSYPSHDDWSNLKYTGGLVGGSGIPLPEVTVSDELEIEEVREIFPPPPPNPNAPVAVATVGAAQFTADASGDASVVLDGSGSYDLDGDSLTYWWFKAGDLIGTGEFLTADFGPGQHLVSLVVEDWSRSSAPSEVSFEVVVPVTSPEIQDSRVRIDYDRLIYNRRTGRYTVDITITNTSTDTIESPLRLVFTNFSVATVTLYVRDGTTSGGDPYLDLEPLLGDGTLDPGDVIVTTGTFSNPTRARFTYTTHVYGLLAPPPAPVTTAYSSSSSTPPPPVTTSLGDPTTVGDPADSTTTTTTSTTTPTVVGDSTEPTVVGGGTSDEESAEEEEEETTADTSSEEDTSTEDDTTPTSGETPSLDGGSTGELPGDTEGGTKPAGAGNTGPQTDTDPPELTTGG